MEIKEIQNYLEKHKLDGWLLTDYNGRNNIALSMLSISGMVTRRSFYLMPSAGEPVALVHAIEKDRFEHLPAKIITYIGYKQMEEKLRDILQDYKTIAMEYSPLGHLPDFGLVDAGMIELVKSFGLEVVSSADMVARFEARLSPEQIATHRVAANNLIEIKGNAFDYIKKSITDNHSVTEYDVSQYILEQFEKYDMETSSAPICAVNSHAGNPHYEPKSEKSAVIKKGQLVLIDLWAKIKHPHGVYADITWMGFVGTKEEIPSKLTDLFTVIVKARDTAVDYLHKHIDSQVVLGSEVDDICRQVIVEAGFGDHFTHRTGHSITSIVHGNGPNIDNLETEDNRKLQKGHLFSVEPGLYFDDFGFRTEIDVLIGHNGVEVTTLPLQMEIKPLF